MSELDEAGKSLAEEKEAYRGRAIEEFDQALGNALTNYVFAIREENGVGAAEVVLSSVIAEKIVDQDPMVRMTAVQAILRALKSPIGE